MKKLFLLVAVSTTMFFASCTNKTATEQQTETAIENATEAVEEATEAMEELTEEGTEALDEVTEEVTLD